MHVYTLNVCLAPSEARRGQWTPWSWSHRWCKIPCGCWELNWDPLNLSRINSISINIVPKGWRSHTHSQGVGVIKWICLKQDSAAVSGGTLSLRQKGKQIFGLFPSSVFNFYFDSTGVREFTLCDSYTSEPFTFIGTCLMTWKTACVLLWPVFFTHLQRTSIPPFINITKARLTSGSNKFSSILVSFLSSRFRQL